MTLQQVLDVIRALWGIVTIPYVALGYIPFIGGWLQTVVSGLVTVAVVWYVWKFLPRRLTGWLLEHLRALGGWVVRKSGGAVGAMMSRTAVEYRDRVVYKTSWRARVGFFAKDALVTIFLALGVTLYFHQTVVPWLSWVGGMVR
jgi:hypothetical protein